MTTRTPRANAKTLSLSLSLWAGAVAIELREKIEGARDGNGSSRPSELEGTAPGRKGIGNRLDMLEVRFGTGREVPCPDCPGIRGFRGDQGAPQDGQGLEHQLGPLVGQDRADEDIFPAREAGQEIADSGEI